MNIHGVVNSRRCMRSSDYDPTGGQWMLETVNQLMALVLNTFLVLSSLSATRAPNHHLVIHIPFLTSPPLFSSPFLCILKMMIMILTIMTVRNSRASKRISCWWWWNNTVMMMRKTCGEWKEKKRAGREDDDSRVSPFVTGKEGRWWWWLATWSFSGKNKKCTACEDADDGLCGDYFLWGAAALNGVKKFSSACRWGGEWTDLRRNDAAQL